MNTIVVALSTAARDVPVHVAVEPSPANGLRQRSYVLCEQVLTVSRERLDEYIGELDDVTMSRVNQALKRILQLP